MRRSVVILADGRSVDLVEIGDPDGAAIWVFHGTPGGPLAAPNMARDGLPEGVRLCCAARPGYGRSGAVRGGSVRRVVTDLAELNTLLGIESFALVGVSGGGPYAAAAAAALPDRVTGLAILAGVSPAVLSDPAPECDEEWAALALARVGRFDEAVDRVRDVYRREVATVLASAAPEFIKDEIVDGTRLGVEGGVFDSFAWFAGPWDAPATPVGCPVWLWYGEADESVPPVQGDWYRDRYPRAELVVTPGATHPGAINPFKRAALDLLAGTLA